MKPTTAILSMCLLSFLLLPGCGGSGGHELVIEFPKTTANYRDSTKLLKIYAVISEAEEANCEALLSGAHDPDDDGYSIEENEVLVSPFTEDVPTLKVAKKEVNTRLIFIEGENARGDLILRGCTEVNPADGAHEILVSLSAACPIGKGDCDIDLSNGCERDITTVTDCGGCGSECINNNGTTTCANSVCAPICEEGFGDCDGDPGNGCETDVASPGGCNGHATSCTFSSGILCACSPAYGGRKCNQCAADAFGTYPNCFMPSQTYCLTSQCFPVPPTGQLSCYNGSGVVIDCPGGSNPPDCQNGTVNFCGQDAQYPKARTFSCRSGDGTVQGPCVGGASDNEVVSDSLTGFMWQRMFVSGKTWQEATEYCDTLEYGGYTDWRLPNPFELHSIVDFSRYNPSIDPTVFPGIVPISSDNTYADWFHTSSGVVYDSKYSWYISFFYGRATFRERIGLGLVRCVRLGRTFGDSSEGERYISSGTSEPVVTDLVTGLTWQKTAVQKSWADSLKHCEGLSYGGFTDWRMPNVNEIMSLINYSRSTPATDFPYEKPVYLSSTTYIENTSSAWYEYYEDGYLGETSKATNPYIGCVRGGP